MNKITLPTFTCKRCQHTWIPRKPEKPKRCAGCKSPYWETERKTKPIDLNNTKDLKGLPFKLNGQYDL